MYRLPRDAGEVGYDLYEVTSSSLTHSFRPVRTHNESVESDPLRVGDAVHENNFGERSLSHCRLCTVVPLYLLDR